MRVIAIDFILLLIGWPRRNDPANAFAPVKDHCEQPVIDQTNALKTNLLVDFACDIDLDPIAITKHGDPDIERNAVLDHIGLRPWCYPTRIPSFYVVT
jgi:hypothetical protein